MEDKTIRIARRVFLAYKYRQYTVMSGFGYDGADKGIIVLNYHYYPIMWAYQKDGKIAVVTTRKDELAFSMLTLFDYRITPQRMMELGEVGRDIRQKMLDNDWEKIRTFRTLLSNEIWANKLKKFNGAKFLLGARFMMDYDEARTYLTQKYEVSLESFYQVFGGTYEDDKVFKCAGMEFCFNDSSFTKEYIEESMRKVCAGFPEKLASQLMYGKVELKKKFSGNKIGDYDNDRDLIRVNEGDAFVKTVIHELGHRWHYRFSTREQKKKMESLYKLCKKEEVYFDVNIGDKMVLFNGKEIEITAEDNNGYTYTETASGEQRKVSKYMFFDKGNVVSINGKKLDIYQLPRRYAGRNLFEFIACCFEAIYSGSGEVGDPLAKDFREIVENG